MSGHTPGPWEYRKQYYAYEESVIFSGEGLVCSFGHEYESSGNLADGGPCEPYAGTPPNDADARLIAAAPDLLEALKFLVECSAPMTSQQEQCWISIRAAIAKATGDAT